MTSSPSRRYAIVVGVCLILVFQAGAMRRLTFQEETAAVPGLHEVPMQLETWKASGEQAMDANTVAYLKPDEYILRDYVNAEPDASIGVFVAYFKSLQSKYGPHSPRICLPGAGYLVSSSAILKVPIAGRSEGIPVNKFTMEKGDQRILVLYWYQNDRDVWAEEYYGKLRLLPDLIRYRRSDVSLVRLITPMRGLTVENELTNCERFAQILYPLLTAHLASVH